ncbi:YbhB/YbcL family Raf kinase inhibitor-like protein [Leifsonia aquatica]|uniref:YbhB/YbcL family Raf kinase inhibitor-like protein n=1 Tax=Leifsonia aquatica TaxID=144185 RepID=UPI0004A81E66|nr:YbhB/YbcL family Raf kinase inhibitor-like protein [Leifsonia aquatica]
MHPVEALFVPLGMALRKRRPDASLSIAATPALTTPNRIELTSPAFGDGEMIPAKHCSLFIGDDISPALTWGALPDGTVELVLVLEDLDVPSGVPGLHTVVGFAPRAGGLAEGALRRDDPELRFVPTRWGRAQYAGPRPLPGHGPHHYRFHLYALDTEVDLSALSNGVELPAALDGHVLAAGTLTGTRTT